MKSSLMTTSNSLPKISIIGAGKLGTVLGQLLLKSGYPVTIAGSGDPEKIRLTVDVITPGAAAKHKTEAAKEADIVILALPLSRFKTLPKEELAGKIVIDAMNYWWEVDGDRSDFIPEDISSSEAVQEFLSESSVIKALNHMGYHNLLDEARLKAKAGRKAIAIAGDNLNDVATVKKLVNDIGFDPLHIGNLAKGRVLEAGQPAFGANLPLSELRMII